MKINEVTRGAEGNLLTVLQLLKMRYQDTNGAAKISTKALINTVLNTDRNFDYDALTAAHQSNPAIANLIKSFNEKEVILNTGNDSPKASKIRSGDAPVDTVSSMAKRAARHRGASM